MAGNVLMDYGIAVNFFGNYARESKAINDMSDTIYQGFNRLKHYVIGAGVTTALYKFGSSLMHTARELESVYATLLTVFGSKNRVLEHFKEAREFVAKNPILDLEQIHKATEQLALAGQAKTAHQANTNLQYLGDFAMGKNMDIGTAIQAAINAGNGNWEMLRNRGFDNRNFKQTAMSAHGTFVDSDGVTKEKSKELLKVADALAKAKVGTDAYKESVIKFLGIYEAGGMANASKTITGSLRSAHNLVNIFKMEIVGMTQEVGTLSNVISTTLNNAISKFSSRMHSIENIGRGVGQILVGVWGGIDNAIDSTTDTIVRWIDKLNKFFSDYKNNIAPIILFLFLLRLEVEDFVSGFVDGFGTAFKFFIGLTYEAISLLARFITWLGITETKSEALGKILGVVVGTMMGIKVMTFARNMFQPLLTGAGQVLKLLDALIFRQRIFNGLTRMADGNVSSGLVLLRGAFARLGREGLIIAEMFRMVTVGSWAFNASLLANPITWIVVAVIALVAWLGYLIYNWDEVGAKMQNVSDVGLALLAMFVPIIGVPLILAKYWDNFKNIFSNIWDGLKFKVMSWWLTLKFEVFVPLYNFGVKLWNNMKLLAISFIKSALDKFPFLITVFETMRNVWDKIKSGFSSVWSFVEKIYNKLTDSTFISSIVKVGEKISEWFSDSSEEDYKEKLKKYDPKEYEKLYGAKVEKVTSPKTTPTTTNNTTDSSSTTNITGNNILMPKGTDGHNFAQQLKDNTKKRGK